jgi:hypothetical protein
VAASSLPKDEDDFTKKKCANFGSFYLDRFRFWIALVLLPRKLAHRLMDDTIYVSFPISIRGSYKTSVLLAAASRTNHNVT